MSRDLRALLDGVDLEALADRLVGEHRGHGRGARWASPVPGHPQTGRTPPMSIFTDRNGVQRWSCWATGTSGTAIDLVAIVLNVGVAGAIDWLAARHGGAEGPSARPAPRQPRPSAPAEPSADLRGYVTDCQRLLWAPEGDRALCWLRERRALTESILEANLVGFDPGPGGLRRARGLPFRGPGVVLPAFDAVGAVVYAQVRYLDAAAAGRKYDNPASDHGAKPALSWPRRPAGPSPYGPTVVCEGTLDALTVAAAGVPAVALIAAGDARRAADAVSELTGPVVIAVDNDPAGHTACQLLAGRLRGAGRDDVGQIVVPGDLNELAQRTGDRFPAILRAALRGGHPPRRACSPLGR